MTTIPQSAAADQPEYGDDDDGGDGGDVLVDFAAFLIALYRRADASGEFLRAALRREIDGAVSDITQGAANG